MNGDGEGRRVRGGGGAARRAERTAVRIEAARYIERNIPDLEILHPEALEIIEANAETVLQEIGVNFVDNPGALALWKDAGADVQGERVRIPKGLARQLCSTAPRRFTQVARNPARNVEIGGRNLVLAPVYGPPFVRDAEGGRRYATIDDFRAFVKLTYMSKWLHHSGGTVCEPTDVPVNKRHLDMLHAHMTLSDKPYMGSVTEPSRAQDSVEMSKILFGADFVDANTVMTSLININSPLTFDGVMMGALEVYARANQAAIISPFIVGGAMAPVTVAGTLTQVLAEVLAGVAYSQLVRQGAPVIFGAFVTSIDMNSGAPTFGTPEAAHITYGAGQPAVWACPTARPGPSAAPSFPTRRRPTNPRTRSTWGCCRASTSCSMPRAGWKAVLSPPSRSS
jgi:trimethylamine---corrinoid protein Co-methyltransferase